MSWIFFSSRVDSFVESLQSEVDVYYIETFCIYAKYGAYEGVLFGVFIQIILHGDIRLCAYSLLRTVGCLAGFLELKDVLVFVFDF